MLWSVPHLSLSLAAPVLLGSLYLSSLGFPLFVCFSLPVFCFFFGGGGCKISPPTLAVSLSLTPYLFHSFLPPSFCIPFPLPLFIPPSLSSYSPPPSFSITVRVPVSLPLFFLYSISLSVFPLFLFVCYLSPLAVLSNSIVETDRQTDRQEIQKYQGQEKGRGESPLPMYFKDTGCTLGYFGAV